MKGDNTFREKPYDHARKGKLQRNGRPTTITKMSNREKPGKWDKEKNKEV